MSSSSRHPLSLVGDQSQFRQSLNLGIDLNVCEAAPKRRRRCLRPGHRHWLASGLSGLPNGFWPYASLDQIDDIKLAALGLRDALNQLRR